MRLGPVNLGKGNAGNIDIAEPGFLHQHSQLGALAGPGRVIPCEMPAEACYLWDNIKEKRGIDYSHFANTFGLGEVPKPSDYLLRLAVGSTRIEIILAIDVDQLLD